MLNEILLALPTFIRAGCRPSSTFSTLKLNVSELSSISRAVCHVRSTKLSFFNSLTVLATVYLEGTTTVNKRCLRNHIDSDTRRVIFPVPSILHHMSEIMQTWLSSNILASNLIKPWKHSIGGTHHSTRLLNSSGKVMALEIIVSTATKSFRSTSAAKLMKSGW